MGEKHGFDKPMGGFAKPKPASASALRGHFVAASGEFVGTFMFLLFAFLGHLMAASQAAETAKGGLASSQTIIFISMSYGLSLLVNVWVFYRISGGLFREKDNSNAFALEDPAVTVGLIITGALPAVRGLILIPVQILSGICAAAVAQGIVPGDINTVQTLLAPGVSVAQGLFLEMFLTAELTITVLMLAAEKSKDTFLAPIGVGLALFVAEIAGVYYTGASLNPARSFGPCVIGGDFPGYHWLYWLGPLLGALFSGGYYHFIKFFNYEEANPGQDSAGGDFEEITKTHSGLTGQGDGTDLENGTRKSNSRNGTTSTSRSGNRPSSQNRSPPNQNRPHLNSRIESATMHPGFDTYER